jgi:hypothetical protein
MPENTDRLTLEPTTPMTPDQKIEYWYEKWDRTYDELAQQINATNSAYNERARLVALLATIWPATWNYGDTAETDWAVVYIELPTGQATWHVRESDMGLFEHVERDDTTIWDGHTTAEKYDRIARLGARFVATGPTVTIPADTDTEA